MIYGRAAPTLLASELLRLLLLLLASGVRAADLPRPLGARRRRDAGGRRRLVAAAARSRGGAQGAQAMIWRTIEGSRGRGGGGDMVRRREGRVARGIIEKRNKGRHLASSMHGAVMEGWNGCSDEGGAHPTASAHEPRCDGRATRPTRGCVTREPPPSDHHEPSRGGGGARPPWRAVRRVTDDVCERCAAAPLPNHRCGLAFGTAVVPTLPRTHNTYVTDTNVHTRSPTAHARPACLLCVCRGARWHRRMARVAAAARGRRCGAHDRRVAAVRGSRKVRGWRAEYGSASRGATTRNNRAGVESPTVACRRIRTAPTVARRRIESPRPSPYVSKSVD